MSWTLLILLRNSPSFRLYEQIYLQVILTAPSWRTWTSFVGNVPSIRDRCLTRAARYRRIFALTEHKQTWR